MAGYLSIGVAFGFLAVKAGLPWILAPLMSVAVYAGAAQYLSIGFLAAGSGVLELALAVLLVNARHAVYGLSFLDRFDRAGRLKPYLVFALTDETYALLSTIRNRGPRFDLRVAALNQSYWVGGSLVGALAGAALPFEMRGIEFALTALFVTLAVEQVFAVRRALPFAIGAAATAAGLAVGGSERCLLAAIGIASAAIIGLSIAAERRRSDA